MFKRGAKVPVRKTYIIVYDNLGHDEIVVYEAQERPSKVEVAILLGVPMWRVWEINEINEIRRLS